MEELGNASDPCQNVHTLLESIINPISSSAQKHIDEQILLDLNDTSLLTEDILNTLNQVPKLPNSMPPFPVGLAKINSQLDQITSQIKAISTVLNDFKQCS